MFNLGFGEIVVILVFVLLFIGPKKLPGLAKGLGKGIKEFNDALRGVTHSDDPSVETKNEPKTDEQVAEVDHSDLEETNHTDKPKQEES